MFVLIHNAGGRTFGINISSILRCERRKERKHDYAERCSTFMTLTHTKKINTHE